MNTFSTFLIATTGGIVGGILGTFVGMCLFALWMSHGGERTIERLAEEAARRDFAEFEAKGDSHARD